MQVAFFRVHVDNWTSTWPFASRVRGAGPWDKCQTLGRPLELHGIRRRRLFFLWTVQIPSFRGTGALGPGRRWWLEVDSVLPSSDLHRQVDTERMPTVSWEEFKRATSRVAAVDPEPVASRTCVPGTKHALKKPLHTILRRCHSPIALFRCDYPDRWDTVGRFWSCSKGEKSY